MIILDPCKSVECFLQSVSRTWFVSYSILFNEGSAIFVAQVVSPGEGVGCGVVPHLLLPEGAWLVHPEGSTWQV